MDQIRAVNEVLLKNLNLALGFLPNTNSAYLSECWRQLEPILVIKLLAGVTLSYGFYKTFELYLTRRKYRHIPGPPTSGYDALIARKLFANSSKLLFDKCVYI